MTVHDHFKAGRLNEAIAVATADVKRAPTDVAGRMMLCELLCFAGDLDRADLHLDTMVQQDAGMAVSVALLRQLLRAEEARRQFHTDGRPPELLREPSPNVRRRLEASIALRGGREGDGPAAASTLEEVNEAINAQALCADDANGSQFVDFRDLDDLTAGVFEAYTAGGRFFWIDMNDVKSIEFQPPKRPIDVLWRGAKVSLAVPSSDASAERDVTEAMFYLPSLYAGTSAEGDEALRLGRATEWHDVGDGVMRGAGHRLFLVGDEARPMIDLHALRMRSRAGAAEATP